jgi:hypothetical protein
MLAREITPVFYAILGGLIYAAWLLVPLVTIALIVRWRLSSWLGGALVIISLMLACPAYLGLMVLLPGWAWPSDAFMPGSEERIGIDIPGYHVDYVQAWGSDFYTTYYEVTRPDGRKAYLEIDGDDNKCWGLTTQHTGSKVYFLCGREGITDRTSYVDVDRQVLYAGYVLCSRHVSQLRFTGGDINPLRRAAGSVWSSLC